MKIGILTVYFADYGSFFHAYCMVKYLQKLGHNCELIHFCGRYKYSPRLKYGAWGAKYLPPIVSHVIAKRIDTYRSFLNIQNDLSALPISEEYRDILEQSKNYDCIILGSDELWSATNQTIRFVPEYFGIGLQCPVFSYSTSGVTLHNPDNKLLDKMRSGLLSLKNISVRDRVTAEWVEKILGKKVPVVLDPTLLYPCFAGIAKYENDYVLVYGEHFQEEHIAAIRKFAEQHNKQIKAIVWRHKWCDSYIEPKSAFDLQNYFKSSYYVMSSTFHGTIFAIVNRKNFTSFTTEQRGLKVQLLLEQLGLQKNLFECSDSVWNEVNYNDLERILQEKRKDSETYLKYELKRVEEAL